MSFNLEEFPSYVDFSNILTYVLVIIISKLEVLIRNSNKMLSLKTLGFIFRLRAKKIARLY
jgi:hypothetical protein